MRKTILLFWGLSLFVLPCLRAQNTGREFIGHITDHQPAPEPLPGVICKAFDADNHMLQFGSSDNNGAFILKDPENKVHHITFDYLGYQSKRIDIKDIADIRHIKIALDEATFNLKEITVTAQPIQRTNDTIRYNVDAFLGQEDRYLGDLLKKLPGITVSEDGTIQYMGDAINKFYIEGHDLMGGQYGVATNNLPVDAVAQIQLLERNQPIRALKDLVPSDRAGLNIKLKKNRLLKPFGEVKGGLGLSPLLYDGKLFTTQIGAKVQSLAHVKMNNTGQDLENELKDKLDANSIFSYSPPPENLILPNLMQNLGINEERYLFNQSAIGSLNNLVALAKETELRINVSYLKDKLHHDFDLQQTFATAQDPLVIEELSRQINQNRQMQMTALFEHNASRRYFKNELKSTFGNADNFETITNDLLHTKKYNDNRPSLVQNNLQGIIHYGDKRTLSVNSLVRYFDNRESLALIQNQDSLLSENISGRYFLTKNRIHTSFPIAGQSLGISLHLHYESNDIHGAIPVLETTHFSPAMEPFLEKTSLLSSDLTLSYQIKHSSRSTTTITLPFVSHHFYNASERSDKRGITPSLSHRFKINHQWETYFRTSYDLDYGRPLLTMMDHPFFRNHRQLYIPSGIVGERTSFHVNSNLKYNNLVDMLFYNFNILYRQSTSNYISKSYYTPDRTYLTTEKRDDPSTQFISSMNLTQSFVPIKLAVTLTPQYTQFRSSLIQQDLLFQNRAQLASLTLKLDSKYFQHLTLAYQASGRQMWNDNNIHHRRQHKEFQHKMDLWYFPIKRFNLSLSGEHSLLERENGNYDTYLFANFKARYLLKKVEFEFIVNNLSNNRHYALTNLSGINSSFRTFPLREREFLLSAKVSF